MFHLQLVQASPFIAAGALADLTLDSKRGELITVQAEVARLCIARASTLVTALHLSLAAGLPPLAVEGAGVKSFLDRCVPRHLSKVCQHSPAVCWLSNCGTEAAMRLRQVD